MKTILKTMLAGVFAAYAGGAMSEMVADTDTALPDMSFANAIDYTSTRSGATLKGVLNPWGIKSWNGVNIFPSLRATIDVAPQDVGKPGRVYVAYIVPEVDSRHITFLLRNSPLYQNTSGWPIDLETGELGTSAFRDTFPADSPYRAQGVLPTFTATGTAGTSHNGVSPVTIDSLPAHLAYDVDLTSPAMITGTEHPGTRAYVAIGYGVGPSADAEMLTQGRYARVVEFTGTNFMAITPGENARMLTPGPASFNCFGYPRFSGSNCDPSVQ